MSVTILLSPSLSRLFLFQAGFSFYQVSRQGCFRGSGVCFGDRLCSALFKSTGSVFVGARCIQEERFSQHEKRYYFDDDMAEIAFGLLFFLFCLFLIRLF